MFDMDVMQRSPFWAQSGEVQLLLEPLSTNLGIHYFDYARFYHDNTCLAYFSDRGYVENFVNDANYIPPTFFLQPGRHLWQSYIPESLLRFANEAYSYFHGITIFTKHENYDEFVNFSAPQQNCKILDIYMNNNEILDNFIAMFKLKFEEHIEENFDKRIRLPSHFLYRRNHININEGEIQNYYRDIAALIKSNASQRIVFIDNTPELLNDVEFECMRHLAMGYDQNSIAKMMKLSNQIVAEGCAMVFRKTKTRDGESLKQQLSYGKVFIISERGEKLPIANLCAFSTQKITLSKQESYISNLLVQGKTAKEIAKTMALSYRTVEHYIENIKNKFGIKRKAQLVSFLLNEYLTQ